MQTILKIDLGDANNAPDDTVTIERAGNNLRLTSPAAGTVDLEDLSTASIIGNSFDASDGDPANVLKTDAVGNVIFNDDSLDIDFRMESNGQTHMFHLDAGTDTVNIKGATPNATYPLNVNGSLALSGGNRFLETLAGSLRIRSLAAEIRVEPTTYFWLQTAVDQNAYFECGDMFDFRDVDAASAVRFSIDSANGNTRCYGNFLADDYVRADGGLTTDATDPGTGNLYVAGTGTLNDSLEVINATHTVWRGTGAGEAFGLTGGATLDTNNTRLKNSTLIDTAVAYLPVMTLALGDIITHIGMSAIEAGGVDGTDSGTTTVQLYCHTAATAADAAATLLGTVTHSTVGSGGPSTTKVATQNALGAPHTVADRDSFIMKITLDNQYDTAGVVALFNAGLFLSHRQY